MRGDAAPALPSRAAGLEAASVFHGVTGLGSRNVDGRVAPGEPRLPRQVGGAHSLLGPQPPFSTQRPPIHVSTWVHVWVQSSPASRDPLPWPPALRPLPVQPQGRGTSLRDGVEPISPKLGG